MGPEKDKMTYRVQGFMLMTIDGIPRHMTLSNDPQHCVHLWTQCPDFNPHLLYKVVRAKMLIECTHAN